MAARKPFLLRLDPEVYTALQIWARDELRSLNAQIEFVLRRELQANKRLSGKSGRKNDPRDERGGAS